MHFLLGSVLLSQLTPNVATTPVHRLEADWWASRHEAYVEQTKANDFDVAFLGDSITQGWSSTGKDVWASEIAPLRAANFGIGADSTQHLLWRLENGELLGTKVRLVVLMIGTNHAGDANQTPEIVASGVQAVVGKLLNGTRAKILILGIFPREIQPDHPLRLKNMAVNKIISGFADNQRVFYRDIGDRFVHANGTLRLLFVPDKVHLSKNGYRLWANAVVPEIQRLLD